MIGLIHTATVYVPDENGDYTVIHRDALQCRLTVRPSPSASAERADLTENRRLLWNDNYMMPSTAQVVVGGQRWNVQAGTIDTLQGLSSNGLYCRCEVTRVSE